MWYWVVFASSSDCVGFHFISRPRDVRSHIYGETSAFAPFAAFHRKWSLSSEEPLPKTRGSKMQQSEHNSTVQGSWDSLRRSCVTECWWQCAMNLVSHSLGSGIQQFFSGTSWLRIKGPDDPTCQLLPISSQRNVKMGWERQEREKRWWRIGVCKKNMSKGGAWKECMQ